ncbi:MAG: hypothetical protein RQ982_04115 [Gammaproteobacteria bacterium]|nr:hypothetical protein [Gammaproteobacteria bacterium]
MSTIIKMGKHVTRYMSAIALLFISVNSYAEEKPFEVVETTGAEIRLANDGTGIVKDIHCQGCDFNIVKITKNSKASNKGIEVNILDVRELNDVLVMVSFNPVTQEVQYIRW